MPLSHSPHRVCVPHRPQAVRLKRHYSPSTPTTTIFVFLGVIDSTLLVAVILNHLWLNITISSLVFVAISQETVVDRRDGAKTKWLVEGLASSRISLLMFSLNQLLSWSFSSAVQNLKMRVIDTNTHAKHVARNFQKVESIASQHTSSRNVQQSLFVIDRRHF